MIKKFCVFVLIIIIINNFMPGAVKAQDEPINNLRFKSVVAGNLNTAAIKEDGTVVAWGENCYNQCIIPNNVNNVKQLASGQGFILVLKEDGTVESTTDLGYDKISSYLKNIVQISSTSDFACALRNDGNVIVWGSNIYDQHYVPNDVVNVKSIAAGYGHIVALKSDGTVAAWGYNLDKQCNVPALYT
ncbi:RCC1 domain-containing protein [Pseudobacteroides cellulosolvens]|uniref:Regulator of chromosome condensation RCC1 n=1 Tax=Pseudobacteroides cellulosolvens ATCC 35603 = DSM 2933 TaxID=398512 RepID=A0A0L6JP94_9FIRM|nr:hypothetical protein [Pseudobacteroides cellulosolvens]KNY27603.1 hypothetical protein Bccel_2874 [Pseudobacteroides cellulosolvens ATCC 35603 = DSM 2933]